MIGMAVAEDDRLDVLRRNLHGIHVVEETGAADTRVEEDRARLVAVLHREERGEAMLGDGLRALEGMGAQGQPAGYLVTGHQPVDGVIHDESNLDSIHRR
jgi:hypothetical protein